MYLVGWDSLKTMEKEIILFQELYTWQHSIAAIRSRWQETEFFPPLGVYWCHNHDYSVRQISRSRLFLHFFLHGYVGQHHDPVATAGSRGAAPALD
jgi:hypothetical protein